MNKGNFWDLECVHDTFLKDHLRLMTHADLVRPIWIVETINWQNYSDLFLVVILSLVHFCEVTDF